MTITALGTANTTIGPQQYADMTQSLTAKFKVDGPNDFKPTISGLRVTIAAGSGFAAGARIVSNAVESMTITPPASGSMWYVVCVRVNWNNSQAQIVALSGTSDSLPPYTRSGSGNSGSINRIPGVIYDGLLAIVKVSAGRSSIDSLYDLRMWGGDGGPYRVTTSGLAQAQWLDARVGTWISTDRGSDTKRLDDDGTWRSVGTQSNPWKTFNPVMRFYDRESFNGTSGGKEVGLGSAPQVVGKYRVVDGLLDGMVSIRSGSQNQFGAGMLTIDLPLPCAPWQPDVWCMGHIYWDRTNGGSTERDWHAELLIKAGWTRALIWAPASSSDARLVPHMSSGQGTGAAGTGFPHNPGGWSAGSVYTFKLSYPVND